MAGDKHNTMVEINHLMFGHDIVSRSGNFHIQLCFSITLL